MPACLPDLADEPPLSVAHGSFEKINLIIFFLPYPCLPPEGSKFKSSKQLGGNHAAHHQNGTHRTAHTAISGHMEGDGTAVASPGRRVVRARGAGGNEPSSVATGVNGRGGWVMGARAPWWRWRCRWHEGGRDQSYCCSIYFLFFYWWGWGAGARPCYVPGAYRFR